MRTLKNALAEQETRRREWEGEMSAQMARMDTQTARMDAHLDGIGTRLDAIDTRLDWVDTRLDRVDNRLDRVDIRLHRVELALGASSGTARVGYGDGSGGCCGNVSEGDQGQT